MATYGDKIKKLVEEINRTAIPSMRAFIAEAVLVEVCGAPKHSSVRINGRIPADYLKEQDEAFAVELNNILAGIEKH